MLMTKIKLGVCFLVAVTFIIAGVGIGRHRPEAAAQERGADRPAVRPQGAILQGHVAAVGKDGKSFVIAAAGANRGDEPTKLDIKLTDKTALSFYNVGANEAKITEGYGVQVVLQEGSKDTAEIVRFSKLQVYKPDLIGLVESIANDGKTITLKTPSEVRGEDKKFEIKLNDKSKVFFTGIGPDEATLKVGYGAQVWFIEGSADVVGNAPQ